MVSMAFFASRVNPSNHKSQVLKILTNKKKKKKTSLEAMEKALTCKASADLIIQTKPNQNAPCD